MGTRTRMTGRKWTEKQREFYKGNQFIEETPLIEEYMENGIMIKRYRAGYAGNVGKLRTAFSVKT